MYPNLRTLLTFLVFLLLQLNLSYTQSLSWPDVESDQKLWTRWWWHGSAVDKDNLTYMMEDFSRSGFGGVEITPIYGVVGQEENDIPYLSSEWIEMLQHTIKEAKRLNMQVDLPPGSGWRCGGPFVTLDQANASLKIDTISVIGGIPVTLDFADKRLLHLMALNTQNNQQVDLMDRVKSGSFSWEPPTGDWLIFVATVRWSGEKVKRAAPGGEGYSIDVYSEWAGQAFLDSMAYRLRDIKDGDIRSFFHDSFEYTGNGSEEILDAFLAYRKYDLRAHIPALMGIGNEQEVIRVQADYRKTLSDMLLNHFIGPLTDWASERGSLNRNQAHGSPGNMLDLYAACDIPETEIFGPLSGTDADILINKFASSAAHVTGKPLASAETSTWLGEHFTVSFSDMKESFDHLFLGGINHLVMQGTAYSPKEAAWPGWVFYASVELNPRNPQWRDISGLTSYVSRSQSFLQSGKPDNDILIYWSYDDIIHFNGRLKKQLAVHHPDWFYDHPIGPLSMQLDEMGYSFDYFSEDQLAGTSVRNGVIHTSGNKYQTIIVPKANYMSLESLENLIQLAENGAKVIFEESLPGEVSGYYKLEERSKQFEDLKENALAVFVSKNIDQQLAQWNIPKEAGLTKLGIKYIRRIGDKGVTYFLKNNSGKSLDTWVTLDKGIATMGIFDPLTGRDGLAAIRNQNGITQVRIQLPTAGTLILTGLDTSANGDPWQYVNETPSFTRLTGTWKVNFLEGGPTIPERYETKRLQSWTDQESRGVEAFSGTASYQIQFNAPAGAGTYLLDLGQVETTASVRLNGEKIGTLITTPYQVIMNDVKKKKNLLEIEVTNLPANRIRYMDQNDIKWQIFRDINFVNIDYKKFDASDWEVTPSGLLGPVKLIKQ